MKRKMDSVLTEWKQSKRKKPLLIKGARQIGKTYCAKNFGMNSYKNVLYINFERIGRYDSLFEGDLSPHRLVEHLSNMENTRVDPENTLIILDEIQNSPRAYTSLKYFCEDAPEYDVVATGSLVDVVCANRDVSTPVGKVDVKHMYPMDFEEYLWTKTKRDYSAIVRDCFADYHSCSIHDELMEIYREYLTTGGMPAAVSNQNDPYAVEDIQRDINDLYAGDMSKYGNKTIAARAQKVWNSLPAQFSKENHKFQLSLLGPNSRYSDYDASLGMLDLSGAINICRLTKRPQVPLTAFEDGSNFKLYQADTGLLFQRFGLTKAAFLSEHNLLGIVNGALTENYLMQSLVASGITPYYWKSGNSAEVDFIFQSKQGKIVPVECKSSSKVRSKSLEQYCITYDPDLSIRVSGLNFGNDGSLASVPLYAAFCIDGDIGSK